MAGAVATYTPRAPADDRAPAGGAEAGQGATVAGEARHFTTYY